MRKGIRQGERRKNRGTHRLITRGAILESLIENAEKLTDEEIKILPYHLRTQKECIFLKVTIFMLKIPTRE